ncbi:uncharacterized protein B0T23DRAFT_318025 [Neurospora hispaniola]|uniref:Uncharacterized protein n=1 Tax=Neurospora hispaniola TaxID=588809 RepID=A0AAJ0I5J3_9PEZI|nr:hypothetical protein B0T23DRAFT_318025 [Neurospora hispaniola]
MPSNPNAKAKPPRLVLFDIIPELTIVTGSISEMINSPTKVKPQNSPNSPITDTFDGSGTTTTTTTTTNNNDTTKFSSTQPSPTSPTTSRKRDKNGKKRKRSGSGRKGRGPCTAEFDYLGWSAWGSYRRSVTGAAARRALTVGGGDDDDSGKKKLGSSGKRRLTSVSLSPRPSLSSSSNNKDTTATSDSDSSQSANDKVAAARLQDFSTWHLIPVPPLDSSSPSSSSPPGPGSKSPRATTLAWHHVSERETGSIARAKEKMYVERTHNCWSHCDYPSECRQTVIAACEEGRAKIDRKAKKLVWVNDREKDAIEARRRKERERERETMKKALGARRSRSGQEERERRMGGQRSSGRKGRGHGGNGSGSVGEKKSDDSSSSASTSSAGGSSSSSSDASGSEDEQLLVKEATIKFDWKETMIAAQGMQKDPEDDNTGNLTIATLEPYSRLDGCSSRQDCYITMVADEMTIDPAKLLKDDLETIPVSPVSPLAGGRLALGIANPDIYESFASFI